MPTTTSLKLPDALKAQIAAVATREGKSAHALMVDTLQAAMNDAALRQQFYDDGEASYQEAVRTNVVYDSADVRSYITAHIRGEKPRMPKGKALDRNRQTSRA